MANESFKKNSYEMADKDFVREKITEMDTELSSAAKAKKNTLLRKMAIVVLEQLPSCTFISNFKHLLCSALSELKLI